MENIQMENKQQQRLSDPGILALKTAAEHFDKSVSESALQHKLGIKEGFADELDICRCAAWIGLKARAETVELGRLENLPMPALTQVNGLYCVMLASRGDQVQLQHPETKQLLNLDKAEWGKLSEHRVILLAAKAVAKGDAEFGFSWFIPSIIKHISQKVALKDKNRNNLVKTHLFIASY